ncbi:MAG: PLP-dependent aminotransferase family protein [Christensenellales bacterium]|jgi:2-aminoadipate transaminase
MQSFSERLIAPHMAAITGSAIREIFHLLGKPGMISFAGGNPANSALEPDVIGELAKEALAKHGTTLLQYGATEGFAPFKESYARYLTRMGFSAQPNEVLPTQGSGQAFDLLLKALVAPGDVVFVESPTFLGALQAVNTYQAKMVAMPTDDNGLKVDDELEEMIVRHRPKLMYVIPTFQNPTGVTLAPERRKKLYDMAVRHNVVIAEDDPYRDLRYRGEAQPAIKSYDEVGCVVYLGSFSKLISPGLRVGAAVVTDPVLMRKMVVGKQSADVHSPLLNQAIVDMYLRNDLLPAHLDRICANYHRQLDLMLRKLGEMQGVRHTKPEGGLFVWAALPEECDACDMLQRAVEQNVAYVPGTHFYFDGGRRNTLRLNFSNSEPAAIEQGMDRLKSVIEKTMEG